MQTETVDLDEAQAHFKELVQRVMSGLHVILSEHQKPVAHILPAAGRRAGPALGSHPDHRRF